MVFSVRSIQKRFSLPTVTSVNVGGFFRYLHSLEKEYGLEMNPDFQRDDVIECWGLKEKQDFIEFLLSGGECPPIYFNSPVAGGIYTGKDSDMGETLLCIDGKQRITAMKEFFEDGFGVFGGHLWSEFDDKNAALNNCAFISIGVNRLQKRSEVLRWYLELNATGKKHSESELQRVRGLLKKEEKI